MPLVVAALASYAAGLLAGFGGVFVAAMVAAGIALFVAAFRRDGLLASLACAATGGLLVAFASTHHDLACRRQAIVSASWLAELAEPASPGAYVRARVRAGNCGFPVTIAVERGQADAGAVVSVTGEAIVSRHGLRIARGMISAPRQGAGSRLVRMRARAGLAIDLAFGGDAPLARALLIADARSIDPAVRDRYAAAGIVHMLSISGLHVAIIAVAVQLLFQVARLPAVPASLATICITAAYIAMIGAPAPAVRAGVMLGVTAISRLMQRPTSPWAALAVGAAAPLADPRTVLEVGYQLSVAGMASLVAGESLSRRWITDRSNGVRARLVAMALTSTLASAVTAPIVAWNFGRLSVVAPLANIVATPIIALTQPALFLALALGPLEPAARFVADATHPLLVAFDYVAVFFSSLPHAAFDVAPSFLSAALMGIASVALVVACVSYFPLRAGMVAITSFALVVWLPAGFGGSGRLELHAIDVGQGDAIALRTPRGRWILFDAGRSWPGGDAGRSSVIPYIRRRHGDVVAFVLSHPHADHVGGASSVLRALRPNTYLDGAYLGSTEPYRQSLANAQRLGVSWRRVRPHATLDVDGVRIRFLAPDSTWMQGLDDPNDASVVALVRYGDVRFLLVGDAERGEEAWLLSHAREWLRADVLKVGHHGSVTSTTAPFLFAVRPRIAIVSVGAGNGYGHPSARVLSSLAAAGSQVLRTDRLGNIVIRTDGRTIQVDAEGDTWALPGAW
ncbi:MAG: DNA internalization-related competence protein ComEC/Rec2 [Gemmatimonadaceae bacterium]